MSCYSLSENLTLSWEAVIRYLLGSLAIALLVLGIVALVSPVPVGVILITIGMAILVCVSDTAKAMLKKVRTRYQNINLKLHKLEAKLEKRFTYLVTALIQTRPTGDKEDSN